MGKENPYSERDLLLLVANGDKQAYQQLFNSYWEQVYGAGLHLTKSPEMAKDLAQDIFLKLWDTRSKLSGIRNLSSYLFVITKNLFHDQLRTRIFRESNKEFLINYFSYKEYSPQERLEQKELSGALHEAICNLPPKLQQVFILHRFEGLSHEEIGKRLGISSLSSKTYITRALIILRKEMGQDSGKWVVAIWLYFRILFS